MSSVFKSVAKVVKWVGSAVADVVEFAVEGILEPIVSAVGGVVEGMLDNPLTAIATIASFAIPGMPLWVTSVINAVATAVDGGSPLQILAAVAAPAIGGAVSKAASSAIGTGVSKTAAGMGFQAGTQSVTAQIASRAAGQAASSAVRAASFGFGPKDILKAAATGALTGAATEGISLGIDHILPTDAVTGTDSDFGFKVDSEAYDRFTSTANTIGLQLSDIAEGWSALPEPVREAIKGVTAASAGSYLTTGKVDESLVAGSLARAVMTTNVTAKSLAGITDLSDEKAVALSKIVGDVVANAYRDVDPYEAYKASLTAATTDALVVKIDEVVGDDIDRALDAISGAGADARAKLGILTNKTALRDKAATAYNAAITKTNDAVKTYEAHREKYNNDIRFGPEAKEYKGKHIDPFVNDTYPKLTAELKTLREEYDALDYGLPGAAKDYTEAQERLFAHEASLAEATLPVKEQITEKVVRNLRPDFNSDFVNEEYLADPRIASGELPAFTNPYDFWLDTGRRLAVSAEDYDNRVKEYISEVVEPDILANLSDYTGRYSDLGDYNTLVEHVKERIGPNLIAIQTDWDGIDGETLVRTAAQEWIDTQAPYELPAILAEDELPAIDPEEEPARPRLVNIPIKEGMDHAKIVSGEARLAFSVDEDTGQLGVEWTDELPETTAKFSEVLNRFVKAVGKAISPISPAMAADEIFDFRGYPDEWVDLPFSEWAEKINTLDLPAFTPEQIKEAYKSNNRSEIAKRGYTLYPDGTWKRPRSRREMLEDGYYYNPNNDSYEKWVGETGKKTLETIPADSLSEGSIKLVDPETNETIEGYENGIRSPDGTITFEREDGIGTSVIEEVPIPAPIGIIELGPKAPLIAMDTLQNLEINEEAYEGLSSWGKFVLNRAIDIKDVTDWLVENETELREEFGFEVPEGELISDRWRKNISTVVGAYSEQAEQLSGWVSLLGEDARKGELNKVAKAVSLAMVAINPPEYNAIVDELNGIIGAKEGWMDKAQALGNAFTDRRYTEAIAREYLAKEFLQEGPIIIASGGTGLLVKSGIKYGTKALAKSGVKEFTKEVAEQAAKKWGLYAAIGEHGVLSFLETAFTNGGETFEEVYDEEYERMLGEEATPEEAHESATRIARRAAVISALITGSTEAVVGNLPGVSSRKFSEAIAAGSKRLGSALDVVKSMALEGIGEATEETLGLLYKVGVLKEINPAIVEEGGKYSDLGGNLAANQIIGFLVGAHTSGAVTVAHKVYELGTEEGDPFFSAGMDFPTEDQAFDQQFAGAGMDFPTAMEDPIAKIIADVNPTINEALRKSRSSDPVISKQGEESIRNAFGWDNLPTINMEQNEDGVYEATDPAAAATREVALNTLKQANPYGWNTTFDVRTAYENNSVNPDYKYNENEIFSLTGEVPVTPQTEDLLALPAPYDLQQVVDQDIDDKSLTYDEVQETAAEEGYFGISPEDAKPFIGQGDAGFDESTRTTVTDWADEHAVVEDEVTTSLGSLLDPITGEPIPFTAGPNEFEQFIGQGGPTFEQDVLAHEQLLDYTEDRQLTPRNIRETYKREGTIATQADIDRLRGQGGPEFRSTREAEIQDEQDPLAVVVEEVEDIYREMGLDTPITPKDKARLSGQYPEAELEERATEYLPIATANATAAIFGKRGQDVTQKEVAFVKDLISQQAVLTEAGTAPQPFTSQQLAYDVNNDGVVNEADQSILEQVRTGAISQADIATQSPFAATGIQAALQQQTAQTQQQAVQTQQQAAIQTAQTTAIQNQIAQQTAADKERRLMEAQNQYWAQVMETSPVQVTTPPPAEIKYVYDPFGENIFATPEQASLFSDPYTAAVPPTTSPAVNRPFTLPMQTVSGGGIIEDKTDEILRALGENK